MTPDFCTEAISHTLRCAWACPELNAVLESCSAKMTNKYEFKHLLNILLKVKVKKSECKEEEENDLSDTGQVCNLFTATSLNTRHADETQCHNIITTTTTKKPTKVCNILAIPAMNTPRY